MGWEPGQVPVYRQQWPQAASKQFTVKQWPQPPADKPQQGMGALWAFTASFQVMKGHTIILMASHYNQL